MKQKIKYFHMNNRVTVFLVRDEKTDKTMTLISTYTGANSKPRVDVYDGVVYSLLLIKAECHDRAYGFKQIPLPR